MASTLLSFTPLSADFTSSASAPVFAARNGHRVLEFAASLDKETFFTMHMPESYAGDGLTVTVMWMAKTAIVGDAVLGASFERHADQGHDLDADSFAPEKLVTSTAPTTSGQVQYATISFLDSEIDGLLKGEEFRIRVRVVGTDGAYNIADIVQVLSVRLSQTSSGGGGGGGFFSEGLGLNAAIGQGTNDPIAGGENALAQGNYSEAQGLNSFALGYYCRAPGAHSASIGDYNYSDGLRSFTQGKGCDANGLNSFAAGYYAQATADHSTAFGYFAYSLAARTFTHGYFARADAAQAWAHGLNVYARGINSTVFGNALDIKADSNHSSAFGFGHILTTSNASFASGDNCDITSAPYCASFGRNNTINLSARSHITGSGNTISAADCVAFGFGHALIATAHQSQAFGSNCDIDDAFSFAAGSGNRIFKSNQEVGFVHGTGNTLRSGRSMVQGVNNIVGQDLATQTGGGHSHLVQGFNNKIYDNNYFVFMQGRNNLILAASGTALIQGDGNTCPTGFAPTSTVLMQGTLNTMRDSKYSMVQGRGNNCYNSMRQCLVQGKDNTVLGNSADSLIQGYNHAIGTNNRAMLVQGLNHATTNNCSESLIQGLNFSLSGGLNTRASIICGRNNTNKPTFSLASTALIGENHQGGWASLTVGYTNIVESYGVALGYDLYAGNWMNFAHGAHNVASGVGSWASGYYVNSPLDQQIAWGADHFGPLGKAQGSQVYKYLETTDGVQATMFTLPLELDKGYSIRVHLVAYNTTTAAEVASFVGTSIIAYRNAGAAVMVTDPFALVSTNSGGGAAVISADLATSTNDVVLRVTGELGETYEWCAIIEFVEVLG